MRFRRKRPRNPRPLDLSDSFSDLGIVELAWIVGAIQHYDPIVTRIKFPFVEPGLTVWKEKIDASKYLAQRGGYVHLDGIGVVPAAIYPIGLQSPFEDCTTKDGPFRVLATPALLYPRGADECEACARKDRVLKRLEEYLERMSDGRQVFSRREAGFAHRDAMHGRLGTPAPAAVYNLKTPSELIDEEMFPDLKSASDLHSNDGERN